MMKLTYFKTQWTAAEALAVKEFLESLIAGIETSYGSEIDEWFENMRRDCIRRHNTNSHHDLDQEAQGIPF